MTTIAVQDKYADILTTFGNLQESVDTALQRYTIEQITSKVKKFRQKNAIYQDRYGVDYPTFSQRIAKDEEYVEHIEANVSKTWEIDLADWEFCYKGIDDWARKLQDILIT
ncbi:MAG: hypothetical protein MAG431_00723 [Chloroflexi bacterium]|nr:hypothetical protein [Chloroflexota bacterium]